MIRSRTLSVNAISLHVLTAGDPARPLLLFLHGFPEYSGAWEEMLTRLSGDFFCVAPDQRGYGRSAKPAGVGAYKVRRLVADAAALTTCFAPKARAVIGHDWGASVAYAFAIKRPELMENLVIINGAHPIPFQRALAAGGAQSEASQYFHYFRDDRAEARLAQDGFKRLRRLFDAEGDKPSHLGARLNGYLAAWSEPGAMTGMLNWYRATPLRVADPGAPIPEGELQPADPARLRIRPRHLLIWGRRDKAFLAETTEGLEDLCDDLTRVEIEDADHWVIHQKPDEVAALIQRFCG